DSLGYYERFNIHNNYHYHNLSWKESIFPKWKMQVGISYSNNKDEIEGNLKDEAKNDVLVPSLESKNFKVDAQGHYWSSRIVMEHRLRGLSTLRFGSEMNTAKEVSVYQDYSNQSYPGTQRE